MHKDVDGGHKRATVSSKHFSYFSRLVQHKDLNSKQRAVPTLRCCVPLSIAHSSLMPRSKWPSPCMVTPLWIKIFLPVVTEVARFFNFRVTYTTHKALSCLPRWMWGNGNAGLLPVKWWGQLPLLLCSEIQQLGAFSTGRRAKEIKILLCEQTKAAPSLSFKSKSF